MEKDDYTAWGFTLSLRQPSTQPLPPSWKASPPRPPPFTFQYIPLQLPTPPTINLQQQQLDNHQQDQQERDPPSPPRQRRRRQRIQYEDIPPPFPWATSRHATVHTLDHLISQGITKIKGIVQCKRCEVPNEIEFDLIEKFTELADYIYDNRHIMHDRAPDHWLEPVFPKCESCGQENCMKPVISPNNNGEINWLFLLLGQMIGCCKTEQLKYFCKHTNNHSNAAKDRLVYLTYFALCNQLQPNGPYLIN